MVEAAAAESSNPPSSSKDAAQASANGTQKLPPDTPLESSYQVWAMVKQTRQQQQQQQDLSETYITDNKVVASFGTIGEFWHVYSHFRRPSVMPLGTFLHYVSHTNSDCFSGIE